MLSHPVPSVPAMKTEWRTVAERQHGLVTLSQLFDSGVTQRQVFGLVRRRVVRRARRGVYAVVGTPPSWKQSVLAAVSRAGDQAVASHRSAAALWSFRYVPDGQLEITVPREQCMEIKGVRVHRSSHLLDVDIAHRDAIPCTTFERTLCDLTTQLSTTQLARTLDDGLRRRVCTIPRLAHCAERLESGPGRHMSVIRSLLVERGVDFNPGGSNSELRVLEVVRDAGLPVPVQQFALRIEGRHYELDYAWPERMLFAEYYGLNVHSLPSAVAHDSERLTALVAHGWTPLVFTDATSDRVIEDRVRAALAAA